MSTTEGAGDIVAITGAGGAVASAVADHFAARGWRLALFARPAGVDALRARYPHACAVGADLTDPAAVREAVATIETSLGAVGALLNIAGGFAMQSATEVTPDQLEAQLAVNLRTAFNVTGAVLPGMVARKRGFVLGVSAASATDGGARMPAYAASKGALTSYLRAVCSEVESKGVGVSILFPIGTIDTPANRRSLTDADPEGWIDPAQIAEAMLFLATRSGRGRVRELRIQAARRA